MEFVAEKQKLKAFFKSVFGIPNLVIFHKIYHKNISEKY